jgi:hypothetical protein
MTSDWIDSQLATDEKNGSYIQKIFPEASKFSKYFRKFGHRKVDFKRLDFDRVEARRFAETVLQVFSTQAPEFGLQIFVDGKLPAPATGEHAIVEIALDIRDALRRGEGRPTTDVDPIEAHLLNEKIKSTRKRSSYDTNKYEVLEYARLQTAEKLGISKNTLSKSIKKGRDALHAIEEAKGHAPEGSDLFSALVDPDNKTVEILVTPPKIR